MMDKNQAAGAYVVHGIAIDNLNDDSIVSAVLDTDEDGIVDTAVSETSSAVLVEGVTDTNNDGVIDTAFVTVDVDKDGVIDVAAVGLDFNQDGVIDIMSVEETQILDDSALDNPNIADESNIEFV